jgi:hypothetical protein
MKNSIVLFSCLFLIGCATVPVKPPFPEVPKELLEKPKPLETVKDGALASEVFETVIRNYSKYHEQSILLEAWQEWYKEQKKLQDSIK